jgi:hypothetical protein
MNLLMQSLLASDFNHFLDAFDFKQMTQDVCVRVAHLGQTVEQVACTFLRAFLGCANLKY